MNRAWVLVANGSRARLFEAETASAPLIEIEAFEAPGVRAHESALTTDLPGESFDSHGQGRHAYQANEDMKTTEMRAFARDLAARLDNGAQAGRYERLYLVASPRMLGMLREALGAEARKRLHAEQTKDWTLLRPDEIRQRLPEYL